MFPPNMIKYNERDFLGRKIYSFSLPMGANPDAKPLSYAASAGYVAFSSDAAALEEFLRSGEGNVKPLREFPGLTEAAQKVGSTGNGYFAFENQKETRRAAFETAKKDPQSLSTLLGTGQLSMLASGGPGAGKGIGEWFDLSLLPSYDRVSKYFYFDVSAINLSPEAVTFKLYSPTPPQLRK